MTYKTDAQPLTDDQCNQVAGGWRDLVLTTMMVGEEEPGGRFPVLSTMATGEEDPKGRCPIALDAHLHR